MSIRIATLTLALAALASAADQPGKVVTAPIHAIEVAQMGGNPLELGEYEGDVLLIVNVASKCGLTPQYAGLQKMFSKYEEEGFQLLGFPCNDFGAQEPGSDEEILEFCDANYAVTFPLFAKVAVQGEQTAPLYHYLTQDSPFPGPIEWNFGKFVIGRDGRVAARFHPRTPPEDAELIATIERELSRDPEELRLPEASAGKASATLARALEQAREQKQSVLVYFGAEWCGWCKKLEAYLARPEIAAIVGKHMVATKLTTDEMKDGESWLQCFAQGKSTGIPFSVVLSSEGFVTARSFDLEGNNIGYPVQPAEIEAFAKLLQAAAPKLSTAELTTLTDTLHKLGKE